MRRAFAFLIGFSLLLPAASAQVGMIFQWYKPAAPGFTPADLGSVVRAWYQMNLLAGSNGDPISTINDSSGNSFTLTQAGSTRGTLAAADLNSLNTIRFTAASTQRYVLDVSILSGSSTGSFYLVQKVVSAAIAQGSPEWGNSANQTYSPFSDGNIYDDFGSTVRKSVGTSTGALTAYRIISAYSAANDWAFYVDGGTGGSSGGTSPLFSTATNTVAWAGSGVNLGANASLTALDGWYGEVIYTNAKQTTGDRQKMEGYLACKWNLQGNFDSTHPYKTSCPTTWFLKYDLNPANDNWPVGLSKVV